MGCRPSGGSGEADKVPSCSAVRVPEVAGDQLTGSRPVGSGGPPEARGGGASSRGGTSVPGGTVRWDRLERTWDRPTPVVSTHSPSSRRGTPPTRRHNGQRRRLRPVPGHPLTVPSDEVAFGQIGRRRRRPVRAGGDGSASGEHCGQTRRVPGGEDSLKRQLRPSSRGSRTTRPPPMPAGNWRSRLGQVGRGLRT